MRPIRIGVASFALLICFAVSALAQNKPAFVEEIERAFKASEPRWKVENLIFRSSSEGFTEEITFRSSEGQAAVSLNGWSRAEDAHSVFEGLVIAFDNSAKREIKHRLQNLGDEGFIWTHQGSELWPTIKFRKGKVIVMVFAPSVAIAKRFAQRVLEHMLEN